MSAATARARLAFPLDYPTLEAARRGAELVYESAGVLKVGLELFVREGPASLRLGAELGCDVFLDLKLHDIPQTVARAVASAAQLGARYLTLHAQGGPRMLEAAQERATREGTGLVLLAVTVLTSLDAADLHATGVADEPATQALRLAHLARSAGIQGLVCSTAEVQALRAALGPDAVLVTPGIRPQLLGGDDQKRVGTPSQALRAGATLLVVGRPIRDAESPRQAARAVLDEMSEALGETATT
ncbi:MAG TPA: orotidine-5'-phosphate decarboxylase [Polyangiaceae bacterium]|nr:orotidine-5'-phosphate decarboxylase [Polyangiaceae bacterium]